MKLNVNDEDLEKTLKSSDKKKSDEKEKKECKCSPGEECKCDSNEEIGFHKGCLNTLAGERNELIKMIQNVEGIMGAHIRRLQEMGVKIESGKRE